MISVEYQYNFCIRIRFDIRSISRIRIRPRFRIFDPRYVRERPNRPARGKKTIYLLPFEESGPAGKVGCYPDLELLRSMVEAWSHKISNLFWY